MRRTRLRLFLLALVLAVAGHAQSVSTPVAPGLTYTAERVPAGPWEVRVLTLERGAQHLGLDMALGRGRLQGVEQLSGIIAREATPNDTIVAAVNDDFFVMAPHPNAGLVSGLCVRRGELVMTARNRPAFVLMADGTPRLGVFNTAGTLDLPTGEVPLGGLNQPPVEDGVRAVTAIFGWPIDTGCVAVKMAGLPLRVNGEWVGTVAEIVPAGTARQAAADEVLLQGEGAAAASLAGLRVGDAVRLKLQTPDLPGPVAMAAAGNLVLLKDGQIPFPENAREPRHPRTLIGFNDRRIIIATVDGRQAGWSVGMTYREEAALMQRLGCTDAINLDGGGSTTAWVRGKVVNRPSDGGERRIANAILVRSTAPHGPLARLVVAPARIIALPDACVPLTLTGVDEWYNPVTVRQGDLTVTVSPQGGAVAARLSDAGLRLRGRPGTATVRLGLKGADKPLAEVPVQLVAACDRLKVTPDPIELCAGESARVGVEGLTNDGEPVALPDGAVTWGVEGAGLTLADGLLRAREAGAVGALRATLGNAEGKATVRVASEVGFEDFEGGFHPTFDTAPGGDVVTGKVGLHIGGGAQGRRYCRLDYDLGQPTGTRAAYVNLDRPLGSALRLSLQARATGDAPWLRVAVVDGNRTRQTFTLADRVNWGHKWRRVQVRLPDGLKPPLTWQSVYVVATAGQTRRGRLEIDDLRVERTQ